MLKVSKLFEPYRGLPREIYVLFIARIVSSIGTFVFPLLTLILTEKIGMSTGEAGGFMTLMVFAQAPCMLVGGKLADTIGRKNLIVICHMLGAACLFTCGLLRPSFTVVYIIIAGACSYSICSPAMDSVVIDLTNPDERKGAFSLLYMGHNLGFAIAPAVGGFLFKNFLPAIFIGDAVTTFISVILFMVFVKETMPQAQKRDEEQHEYRGLESYQEGSVFKVLLERRILLYFAVVMFLYQFGYSQWGFMLPIQMKDIFGDMGPGYYGLVAGFNGIVVIVFTPLLSKLTHNMSSIKAVTLGGILYAVAFGMLGFVSALPLFFMSMYIMTLGEIVTAIYGRIIIANYSPASHRGRINSVLPLIFGFGYTLGPVVMGRVLSAYGITISWSIIGILVFIGAVFMYFLKNWEAKCESGCLPNREYKNIPE